MVGNVAPRVAAVGRQLVEHARVDAVVLRALPVALHRGGLVQAAEGQLGLLIEAQNILNFPSPVQLILSQNVPTFLPFIPVVVDLSKIG